jgi:glyoxylase-like metal-dependent hydrolase (beta-lactamase superfamily II)
MKQIALGKVNCYFLSNDAGNILVDTGYCQDKELFLSILEKEGIGIADISYVLLTHHHNDHCGLVAYLLEQKPEIQLIMHFLCANLTRRGCNASEYGGKWCSKRMKVLMSWYSKFDKKSSSTYPPFSSRAHDLLLDFSRGPVPFHGFTIIPTPGHTPDSIGLFDDKGNFFCGDAAANFLQFAGTKYAPPLISNLTSFYDTWEKLLEYPIQRIYPGHGKCFSPSRLRRYKNALKEEKLPSFDWV